MKRSGKKRRFVCEDKVFICKIGILGRIFNQFDGGQTSYLIKDMEQCELVQNKVSTVNYYSSIVKQKNGK